MSESDVELHIRRTFSASPAEVFEAWTRPEHLKRWWGMNDKFTTPIAEVDLRVGGRYRLAMKPPDNDDLYIVSGTFLEVNPPHRLVYTWTWENAHEAETTVTVVFHEREGATEVVLTHGPFEAAPRRDRHAAGWDGCLTRLTKIFS